MIIRLLLILNFLMLFTFKIHAEIESNVLTTKKENPVKVVFETSLGSFTIELFADKAPITVNNFLKYVNEGFYENTLFHRVVSDFVIQAGGFESKMKMKKTHPAIINESLNGMKNIRGSVSMARKRLPDSATSQFFVNLNENDALNQRGSQFGYTVFAKVIEGMDVIDEISGVQTFIFREFKDVPTKDVLILSAKQIGTLNNVADEPDVKDSDKGYILGKQYFELENKVTKVSSKKVEVIEIFSYGCPHCFSFESSLKKWKKSLSSDVDFKRDPAVWNGLMRLYAHEFYTAQDHKKSEELHHSLFSEIVIEGTPLLSEAMFGSFFNKHGIGNDEFSAKFDSKKITDLVTKAAVFTQIYKIQDIPAMIVNGKYRVSLESAGGKEEMLKIVDYLIRKEQKIKNKL
ncbi:MAG: peptidylprolyl isomerase [Alcanivoracaceae bacterium]|nr:peptidylprolyl isomerase [Alcanivoracaceae bacterium]